MAYKVQYTPQDMKRYPPVQQHTLGRWRKRIICAALVFFAVYFVRNGVPDFLIPGDPDVTQAAAVEMVSSVKRGVSVQDAIQVFCKQIIEGAGV